MNSGSVTRIVRSVLPATFALVWAASAAHAALVVSNSATRNVTCTSGVCAATAVNAVLNVNDLATMLAAGNVTMQSGATAMDIRIMTPTGWASRNHLLLDAYRSIDFRAPLTVQGTSALALMTDDGGTGGDLTFENTGHVAFWDLRSGLTINGNTYTLVDDIATLVTDINAKPWGYYAWAKDYDASVDGAYKTAPIAVAFVGAFEGLGNKIEKIRFTARRAGNFGLFALVENGGLVRDLTLSDVKINIFQDRNNSQIGAIAAQNHGTIEASSSSGLIKVTTSNYGYYCCLVSGGLVGTDKGAILRAHSSVDIGAGDDAGAGGLVGGYTTDGSLAHAISDSYATGNVTAGNGSDVGGLVGYGQGTIIGGYATGSVTAGTFSYAGGLVGSSSAAIEGSHATGSVSASGYAGGLVGASSSSASIEGSFATSSVTGFGNVGGLVGSNSGPIQTSFASGSVTAGANSSVGGMVGWNTGAIETSFATGSVSATVGSNSLVGGLVGESSQTASLPIENSYALGSVTGGIYVGGLVGKFDRGANGGFSTSYAIGAVSGGYDNGGLIGYTAEAPLGPAYLDWDTDTSGLSEGCGNRTCFGIKGLSDTQLKSRLPAGFDSSIWGQRSDINNGYPYLLTNPPR